MIFRNTIELKIGDIFLGGNNPIVVQSMTNTDTLDIEATAKQAIALVESGCQMVRITAQGVAQAKALKQIKAKITMLGYNFPLIADIHFNRNAAIIAAETVEKIRINPGNFILIKKYEYTDSEYNNELLQIEKALLPLINVCKKNNTAIRIGVNHGSLGNRIVSRYGDTSEGMAESAIEYAKIFKMHKFNNLVLSIKSSNVKIMVEAYLLLYEKLAAFGMNYPIHLGVTEAGDSDAGRIKSIIGIGALLSRGIGDTVRVSLTESPINEIPIANKIKLIFNNDEYYEPLLRNNTFNKNRSFCDPLSFFGNATAFPLFLFNKNRLTSVETDKSISSVDKSIIKFTDISLNEPIQEFSFLHIDNIKTWFLIDSLISVLKLNNTLSVIFELNPQESADLYFKIRASGCKNPIIIMSKKYYSNVFLNNISLTIDIGGLMLENIGDGLAIKAAESDFFSAADYGFTLLQAASRRITKTEFIACPSCGRTLFNIESSLKKVKEKTSHLKGLKIAVMGCIVNGPGEMADADYGYIGAGKGKVNLYRYKAEVKKNIPEQNAVDELVNLIKLNGEWVDSS